jgi:hypothetical protein
VEGLAVSVRTLVPVEGLGLKDEVTPLGRLKPEDKPVARVTFPVKPPLPVTVIVVVADEPCTIGTEESAALREKPGGCATIPISMRVLALRVPEVPVMVTKASSVGIEPFAVSVSTLVLVVEAGANDAVSPLGRLDAVKLTVPVKPAMGATVIVDVREKPACNPPELTDELMVKFGSALTVRDTIVVAVSVPEVPVMVTL